MAELQEAKNSILSVTGVSPLQLVFGRSPEVPADRLHGGPGVIASSSALNEPVSTQLARVRATTRMAVLAQQDKLAARRALDARPRGVPHVLPGDMVAVRRRTALGGYTR